MNHLNFVKLVMICCPCHNYGGMLSLAIKRTRLLTALVIVILHLQKSSSNRRRKNVAKKVLGKNKLFLVLTTYLVSYINEFIGFVNVSVATLTRRHHISVFFLLFQRVVKVVC